MSLVAVDWGTSALRGALLDDYGHVLEQRSSGQGILQVPKDEFATVFEANFAHWTSATGQFDSKSSPQALISGMAGSQQGWIEAPYCPCPAGFDDLAERLAWVQPRRIAIVPGLCCEHDGVPDVMRGEEVQIFGALQLLGLKDAHIVLPGTHSKWASVRAGRILHFRSFMTGEFFALLRQHSILNRTLPDAGDANANDALDLTAFDDGVAHAMRSKSLLNTAFSARTLALFKRRTSAELLSYLSGLVIGEELRAQDLNELGEVIVVGSEALTTRYERALAQTGVPVRRVGAEATWQGLWAISQALSKPHDPSPGAAPLHSP